MTDYIPNSDGPNGRASDTLRAVDSYLNKSLY
jgi:hypothetical protein